MHASAYNLMREFARQMPPGTLLDVGSRDINGCLRTVFSDHDYTGLDITSGRNVDVVVDDHYNWRELQGQEFDAVISGQCLEHCQFPWRTAEQIIRHCRMGGLIAITAPFRQEVHGYPYDYFRFTGLGLAALFQPWVEVIDIGQRAGSDGIWDAWLFAKKTGEPEPNVKKEQQQTCVPKFAD